MGNRNRPSLENLVDSGDLVLESIHPGGLEITRELAELCHVTKGAKVLDVASGTGESACYLAERYDCRIVGIDLSDFMVQKARRKAREKNLDIRFTIGDAHRLPFEADLFDAVISECTVCLLNKERAISEMVRVARRGGYVGIHDICWKEETPAILKQRLADIEGERPETINGWRTLFESAGLVDVTTVDKSHLISVWTKEIKRDLGLTGFIRIALKAVTRWGIAGLRDILKSDRIFRSGHTGYGIIVGRKP
ncbi:MAG: methyltransferase domain-containing protein [Nitrospiraceae bacterium]|nr:methyltransferase domain-containing protein [Nitrospiraceae bacterium]